MFSSFTNQPKIKTQVMQSCYLGEEELMSIRFYIGFLIVLGTILLNGIYKRQKQT